MKENSEFDDAQKDDPHHRIERDVLCTLNDVAEVFQASQTSYLDGAPDITGSCVSKCLSREGTLIGVLHSLTLTITFLHDRHHNEPYSQLPQQFAHFCRILRHCVNPDGREAINRLSRLFVEAAEYVASDRITPIPSLDFAKKLRHYFELISDLLCSEVRDAVIARESAIQDSIAQSITPERDKTTKSAEQLDRNYVVRVVRMIRYHSELHKTCNSIPKAVNYVRYSTDIKPELIDYITNSRAVAKQNKNGEDKFWNSVATKAKDCNYKKRKPKDPNAPPGPTPILDRGVEYL